MITDSTTLPDPEQLFADRADYLRTRRRRFSMVVADLATMRHFRVQVVAPDTLQACLQAVKMLESQVQEPLFMECTDHGDE